MTESAPPCEGGPFRCDDATLTLGGGRTAFPDAVTTRGLRHLRVLDALGRQGHRAVLLFCASRNDTRSLEPADTIDPKYGRTLRCVVRAGVEVPAHRCRITRRGVWLGDSVPVRLVAT